jgi:hypothetical protein
MGEMRNANKFLDGKTEGMKPLCRPRHRQECNIKMGLKEYDMRVGIGFSWLRIGSSDGPL